VLVLKETRNSGEMIDDVYNYYFFKHTYSKNSANQFICWKKYKILGSRLDKKGHQKVKILKKLEL